ncbi:probable aspartyl protease At4g16563 [Eucalyptus grandis]|uniref:probable aspartyl protease At4g16563 n=1 Tax=Eucalyptus grandis TaxID=71139 RepID=UPI00192EC461|nr:probable aspartyl protease At4g16563 [Eucalyptus grandis]
MASSLRLFVLLLFIAHHFSTSFSAPIFLPLTHSLSTSRFNTTHHLLKSASARSAARSLHHRLGRHLSHRSSGRRQVSLPLSPGSDYTLSFTLDSHPPQSISLFMDTGSDLVWFPCAPFDCILCEGKPNPNRRNPVVALNRSSTSTVSCKSPACAAAHSSLSSSDLCAAARCPLESIEISDCASFSCPPFYYAYGDGSFIATLYRHSVSIPTSPPALVLRNFTFGCAHSALGEPVGVAGFGRGSLSLPAQLARLSPQLGNRFSYCLVSHSFEPDRVLRPSPLILGRKEKVIGNEEAEFVYTEMLDNPKHPYFYCVGLQGITVGRKHILAAENLRTVDGRGNGGMVVDSGTTFTMLPAGLYGSVVAEFERRLGRVHKRATEVEDKTGLSPCFHFDNDTIASVPTVTLHFVGQGSSVVLPRRNYFYDFTDGGNGGSSGRRSRVGCLMLMSGWDEAEADGGPVATLGNYQQQGFEVVYDLEKRRVGFARRRCSTLWDSLNQH